MNSMRRLAAVLMTILASLTVECMVWAAADDTDAGDPSYLVVPAERIDEWSETLVQDWIRDGLEITQLREALKLEVDVPIVTAVRHPADEPARQAVPAGAGPRGPAPDADSDRSAPGTAVADSRGMVVETQAARRTIWLHPGSLVLDRREALNRWSAQPRDEAAADRSSEAVPGPAATNNPAAPRTWSWDADGWGAPPEAGTDLPWVEIHTARPLLVARHIEPPPLEQRQRLTREAMNTDPRPSLGGSAESIEVWFDDGESYLQRRDDRWWRVDAATGTASLLYDPPQLAAKLVELVPGAMSRQIRDAALEASQLHLPSSQAWIVHDGQLLLINWRDTTARLIPTSGRNCELVEFSPDGKYVAMVEEHNLLVADTASGTVRPLTSDGGALVRNGKADWVYYEEILDRDWQSYRWSPDSRRILFLRLDDSDVQPFTIANELSGNQSLETERYPLAGQPNPRVNVAMADVVTGRLRWMDLQQANYSPDQILVTDFGWAGDRVAYVTVQDRAQRWLDLWLWNVDQQPRRVVRQQTGAWVEPPLAPRILSDDTFLLTDEASGFRQVGLHRADGTLLRWITTGNWDVQSIDRVDEQAGWMYVTGNRDSWLGDQLYRVRLDTGKIEQLTSGTHHHIVKVAPRGPLFVDVDTTIDQPEQASVVSVDDGLIRVIDANPVPDRHRFILPPVRLVQIPTRDGGHLEGALVLPPDHDPNRRYPAWIMTYGGPRAPSVFNAWQRGRLGERLLAERGVVVLRVDPRTASNKGAGSAWPGYRQLGVHETRDLEDAVDWLVEQGWADAERIGLSGHSYGGYLTAYVMTHSNRFRGGVAGAPVTAWRNYDSIYTERYMDLPQNNPDGYERSSVVAAAAELHGRLLLLHGGRDDNVHIGNTWQLVQALQRANKDFQLMVYPDDRHGIGGEHYSRLVFNFQCDVLGVDPGD